MFQKTVPPQLPAAAAVSERAAATEVYFTFNMIYIYIFIIVNINFIRC